MKEKLTDALGVAGFILYYALCLFPVYGPFFVIKLPPVAEFLIIGFILFIGSPIGDVTLLGFYIWGLTRAVNMHPDRAVTLFYVAGCVLILGWALPRIAAMIKAIIESRKR